MKNSISLVTIGCGAMGGAIARAVLRKRLCEPKTLTLVEHNDEKRNSLRTVLNCADSALDSPALGDIDVVILAVKPQDCSKVLVEVAKWIKPSQLVISIMAGIPLSALAARLGAHQAIVRSMPNLPAQSGTGMTVYCCAAGVSQAQAQAAQFIFESFGRSLRVEAEEKIDSATALSGTGPAYFYYLLQQMHAVAVECGYSSAESALLLEQTMEGSLALWRETGASPADLISKVASRGGTTEAALKVFENGGVACQIQDGIRAANIRARELAKAI